MKAVYYPLLGLEPGAIGRLTARHISLTILIHRREEGFRTCLGLEGQAQTLLSGTGIHCGSEETISLPQGIHLVRKKERRRGGSDPEAGGPHFLKPLKSPFTLDLVIRSMNPDDWMKFQFTPVSTVKESTRYDKDTNHRFCKSACFQLTATTSRETLSQNLCQDLAAGGAAFYIPKDDRPAGETLRVHPGLVTQEEANYLAAAVDAFLENIYHPDVEALMKPGEADHLPGGPGIRFGHHLDNKDIILPFSALSQHTCIDGSTGSGKGVLLNRMIHEAHMAGIPTIAIMPLKREVSDAFGSHSDVYRAGDPNHPLRFSLLDLLLQDGNPAQDAVDALCAGVNMGGSDSALPMLLNMTLTGILADPALEPSLPLLSKELQEEMQVNRYSRENRDALTTAAQNRLKTLYATREFNAAKSNLDYQRMLHPGNCTIIELERMNPNIRKVFVAIFLERLRSMVMSLPPADGKRPRVLILIDELHELLSGGEHDPVRSILYQCLSTTRGAGVAFVLADQSLEVMGSLATACLNHILLHSNDEPERIARVTGVSPEVMHKIGGHLNPGQLFCHVHKHKTVLADALPLETFSWGKETSRKPQNYLPYRRCERSCQNCDGHIHSIACQAATATVSGRAYRIYYREMIKQKTDEEKALERKKLFETAAQHAVRLAKEKGVALDGKLHNCLAAEFDRQMAFRFL